MPRRMGWLAVAALALYACQDPAPAPVASPSPTPSAVLSPSSDGTATLSPAASPSVYFEEDFNAGSLNPGIWRSAGNGGVVEVSNGSLNLYDQGPQTGFPYVYSLKSVIPPTGPFYFELGYEILQSVDGEGAGLPSFTLTTAPIADGQAPSVFFSTARFYDYLAIFVGTTRYLADSGFLPAQVHHVLRLEGDGLLGAYRLILDHAEIARFYNAGRPDSLILGVYPPKTETKPIPWASYAFDRVESGLLTSPLPASPQPAT